MSIDFLQSISSIVAILVAAGALYASLRKLPVDNRNTSADTEGKSADTAAKYQQIARLAAEEALTFRDRLDEQDKKLEEQDRRIEELERLVAALEDYNVRLVHQLRSNELEPVKPASRYRIIPKDVE